MSSDIVHEVHGWGEEEYDANFGQTVLTTEIDSQGTVLTTETDSQGTFQMLHWIHLDS